MILLHSFYLICSGCGLSKLTFVLTTLATRKQSQIFPQHIAPETPLQHVCDFFEENICFSHVNYFIFFAFDFVKKQK